MSRTVASRYRILQEIGRGAAGDVYLVEHIETGSQCALKVLRGFAGADLDAIERFKREARAAAAIQSEHVVRITDAGTAPELGGAPFLVMEVLRGSDLEQALSARGRLSAGEVVHLITQLARALDRAHALGIVHRDLKPANLFLHRREDGVVVLKLLDFGVSKVPGGERTVPGQSATALTSTGVPIGTPRYMPPEQARGQSSAMGPAADLWAIGMIAFRLLTGEEYWKSETVADLIVEILMAPISPPSQRFPDLPRGFDDWFVRSCERDPQKRWISAGEQATALASALSGRATGKPWWRRPPVLAGATGALVLGVALGGVSFFRSREGEKISGDLTSAAPSAAPTSAPILTTTQTASTPPSTPTGTASASSTSRPVTSGTTTASSGKPASTSRPPKPFEPTFP